MNWVSILCHLGNWSSFSNQDWSSSCSYYHFHCKYYVEYSTCKYKKIYCINQNKFADAGIKITVVWVQQLSEYQLCQKFKQEDQKMTNKKHEHQFSFVAIMHDYLTTQNIRSIADVNHSCKHCCCFSHFHPSHWT